MSTFDQPGRSPLPRSLLADVAGGTGDLTVRLLAYVCGLAMLAVIAADLYERHSGEIIRQAEETVGPLSVPQDWAPATRSPPGFAVRTTDFSNRTETYTILRHPLGGRKDLIAWRLAEGGPSAELEIYRMGGEAAEPPGMSAELAGRSGIAAGAEPETAGVIATKFGTMTLWRLPGAAPGCLGFSKSFDSPRLRLSGWSCQADSRQAQSRLIACTLDRLVLLSAGNDPALADLFARAELRREDCSPAAGTLDWISSAEPLRLRGRL
jgi:hypothetical protein